jgi:hypothetical protein
MQSFIFLLQIGDLFQGKFTWRGAYLLFLFILMALVILGFMGFIGYKAFFSKSQK